MKKYKSNKKKIHISAGTIVLLVVFLVACIIGGIMLYNVDEGAVPTGTDKIANTDSSNVEKSDEADIPNPDVVEIESKKYKSRANLETYLFMGVDAKGKKSEKSNYDGTGQSDVLILFVIDKMANTYAVLPINRDTITAVNTLDENGKVLATTDIQIALAHANGDGLEQSCENAVTAVSNLLYGQKIDGYVSLNMDAIRQLNHLVGGVTVTIEDDFSKSDPSLKVGEKVKLTDEQAMHYVHDRMNVGDGSNECRMRRQDAYMQGLKKILMDKSKENESFALDVFNGLQDYMVTNLTGKNVSRISKAILKNKDLGEFHIKGTSAVDDYGFNAFTVDKHSLADVVEKLFYDEIE